MDRKWTWILILFSALLLVNPAKGQSLSGWQKVLDTIKNQPASKIDELNGKEFDLELSEGAGSLSVTPSAPFQLEGGGRKYKLIIVNAASLVVNNNGLFAKVPLNWAARIGGDGNFDLAIEGVDECLFNLTFKQSGGDVLKLSAMRDSYDVSWTFDNAAAIMNSDLNGDALQVRRVTGNRADVSVRLRLKAKVGSIDVISKPVPIQKCARDFKDDNGNIGVIQIRTPGQCVIQTRRLLDTFENAETHGVNYRSGYKNTCDVPVKCAITFRYNRHNSVKDGIDRVNGTVLASANYDFTLMANGEWLKDHYLSTAEKKWPYYTWSDPWIPDAAYPGWNVPEFKCNWI